jgi:hypothetical protein
MCGEFCTLPALFLKIIFNFSLVAREADARQSFLEIRLAGGVYDVFEGSSLRSRFPMATG